MPGEAGDKAKKDALEKAAKEQRELSKQANELPGQDSPEGSTAGPASDERGC